MTVYPPDARPFFFLFIFLQNIVEHIHEGPFFTANLLKLHLTAPSSTKYNLFQASLNDVNITTIRGDSVLLHKGDVQMEGALRVGAAATSEVQREDAVAANVSNFSPYIPFILYCWRKMWLGSGGSIHFLSLFFHLPFLFILFSSLSVDLRQPVRLLQLHEPLNPLYQQQPCLHHRPQR